MLLRILIISDYNNELAFFEAKERGVVCGRGGGQLRQQLTENNSKRSLSCAKV